VTKRLSKICEKSSFGSKCNDENVKDEVKVGRPERGRTKSTRSSDLLNLFMTLVNARKLKWPRSKNEINDKKRWTE